MTLPFVLYPLILLKIVSILLVSSGNINNVDATNFRSEICDMSKYPKHDTKNASYLATTASDLVHSSFLLGCVQCSEGVEITFQNKTYFVSKCNNKNGCTCKFGFEDVNSKSNDDNKGGRTGGSGTGSSSTSNSRSSSSSTGDSSTGSSSTGSGSTGSSSTSSNSNTENINTKCTTIDITSVITSHTTAAPKESNSIISQQAIPVTLMIFEYTLMKM